MSYREMSAWVYLLAILLTSGPYFAIVASGHVPMEGLPNLPMMATYATACVAQLVLLATGHLYLRLRAPADARAPMDERDLALMHRSRNWAYWILMIGAVWVGCFMPFYSGGWYIVNTTIFIVTVSNLVYYAVLLISYRRQA